MQLRYLFLLAGAVLPLAGCSSDRYDSNAQGAAGTDPYGIGSGNAEGFPRPSASPTFRPGMNPEDPRDSHFTTRPQPFQQPPSTNQ